MIYSVRMTAKARDDIKRLYAYLLQRDEQAAARAYAAIEKGMVMLETFPFSCRRASGEDSLLRELIVPFGSAGYVLLFKIEDSQTVTISAIRHQREEDYH
ncbi:type II toxin-antitoxin system RelE/ParE family toxin [Rhizobium tumorigenes]|uniref:type II toxin-antitoxin system RelE/ParE family toxin n=1 Tax=Rhizobium tumorigenes TaxID=2041385 RepID=UPI00241DBF8E|nr:type II toxin-antitoxin system RelE/ParE family toxin [Rhizobium tumorigenes]WFS01635.1 type II toxin-antitoxin system RelE/ParE family toxin [Rhizobium tumorigenes]